MDGWMHGWMEKLYDLPGFVWHIYLLGHLGCCLMKLPVASLVKCMNIKCLFLWQISAISIILQLTSILVVSKRDCPVLADIDFYFLVPNMIHCPVKGGCHSHFVAKFSFVSDAKKHTACRCSCVFRSGLTTTLHSTMPQIQEASSHLVTCYPSK